jgi:hypothetical protein
MLLVEKHIERKIKKKSVKSKKKERAGAHKEDT